MESKKWSMLSVTINCSIGNEKKHLNDTEILEIINKGYFETPIEKYVIKIIKTEADKEEIEMFAKMHNLSLKEIKEKLNEY